MWWDNLLARDARQKGRRALAVRWCRRLRPVALVCIVGSALYASAFVWQFELLGLPVRDNEHGWLGPPLRREPHVTDIGKIYYYESDDVSSYRGVFRPLCRVWIWMNGF